MKKKLKRLFKLLFVFVLIGLGIHNKRTRKNLLWLKAEVQRLENILFPIEKLNYQVLYFPLTVPLVDIIKLKLFDKKAILIIRKFKENILQKKQVVLFEEIENIICCELGYFVARRIENEEQEIVSGFNVEKSE